MNDLRFIIYLVLTAFIAIYIFGTLLSGVP